MLYLFCDVDGTLIDADGHSRPGIRQFLQLAKAMGCSVILWSGGGRWYAREWAERLHLLDVVDRVFGKGELDVATLPKTAFLLDDAAEVVRAHRKLGGGGYIIPYYEEASADPDEMGHAYAELLRWIASQN